MLISWSAIRSTVIWFDCELYLLTGELLVNINNGFSAGEKKVWRTFWNWENKSLGALLILCSWCLPDIKITVVTAQVFFDCTGFGAFWFAFFLSRCTACSLVLALSFSTHFLEFLTCSCRISPVPASPSQNTGTGERGQKCISNLPFPPFQKPENKPEHKHIYTNPDSRRFLQPPCTMPRHSSHFLKVPEPPWARLEKLRALHISAASQSNLGVLEKQPQK